MKKRMVSLLLSLTMVLAAMTPVAYAEGGNTEAEQQTTIMSMTEGEQVGAEGKQAEGEGEQAAAEGEQAGAEGEQAKAEGEQPGAEGEQAKDEGEKSEGEGEQAKGEGEQAKGEGEKSGAEGEKSGAEGKQVEESKDEQPVLTNNNILMTTNSVESAGIATFAVDQMNETTLKQAVDNATQGETVTLTNKVELTSALVIGEGKEIVLDLNGHSLSRGGSVIRVEGGKLTVKDSGGSGEIYSASGHGIMVGLAADGTVKNGSELYFESGKIDAQEFGIPFFGACTVKISGGTIVGRDNAGLGGNGSKGKGYGGATVTVNGGDIIGETTSTDAYRNCGIYIPCDATVNVTGGNITGDNGAAILIRGGTVNISGGVFTAKGTGGDDFKMGDAAPTYNSALEVNHKVNAGYGEGKGVTSVVVTGGTFKAAQSAFLVLGENTTNIVKLKGGKFEGAANTFNPDDYVAKTYKRDGGLTDYTIEKSEDENNATLEANVGNDGAPKATVNTWKPMNVLSVDKVPVGDNGETPEQQKPTVTVDAIKAIVGDGNTAALQALQDASENADVEFRLVQNAVKDDQDSTKDLFENAKNCLKGVYPALFGEDGSEVVSDALVDLTAELTVGGTSYNLPMLGAALEITLNVPDTVFGSLTEDAIEALGEKAIQIIRLHKNVDDTTSVQMLPGVKFNAAAKTVTFQSDRFSVYAIALHTHDDVTTKPWKSDGEIHWKECESCGEKLIVEPHNFANGVCTVCGYKKPAAPSAPTQTVTATATPAPAAAPATVRSKGKSTIPQTGDPQDLALVCMMLALSAGSLTALAGLRKKRGKQQ